MTVGQIEYVKVEAFFKRYAVATSGKMYRLTANAVALYLTKSDKQIRIFKEQLETKHGCPRGSIDPAFATAKLIAPRIEDAVKVHTTHDACMDEIMAQLLVMKGDHQDENGNFVTGPDSLSWKNLTASLKPQGSKAIPTVKADEVVERDVSQLEVGTVIAPLSPVEQTLFDRCMLAIPNFSGEQRLDMVKMLFGTFDLSALAEIGELLVTEVEVATSEAMQQAA